MRTLLITEYSPFETSFGAQQRSHHLWRALAALGEVDVVLLRQGDRVSTTRPVDGRLALEASYQLLPLGLRKYGPDPELSQAIARALNLARYDVVCARYLGPVSKLALPAEVPVIVDLDDVACVYAAGATWLHRSVAALKTRVKHTLERQALQRYHRFFFVSQRDRDRFPDLTGAVLPNIPVAPLTQPDVRSSGKTIIFVGALWYAPNREGIERFLARCWTAILREQPQARLLVAGAAPQAIRTAWSRLPNVSAPGFVPTLASAYAESAFAIVPVYSGGGSNIKVLEAMAHARACVATRFSFEGFRPNLTATRDLLVATDDDMMIQHCVQLLGDSEARERIAASGHAAVTKLYSYDAFAAVVADQVDQVVTTRRTQLPHERGAWPAQ